MNKYSFSDLLEKKIFDYDKIKIPLLQRDYVQGQKTNKDEEINKTGWRFIKAIFDSMQKNSPLNLDFIYGSIDNDKNFIPLDGQQRLTTLFLLHWYFANKDFDGKELEEKLNMLSRFSYETRISSREFCENLCKMKKHFDTKEIPSIYIRNEPWFFGKFNFDPTINSMLNMLDVIHLLDSNSNASYEKLKLLKFNVLILEKFGLSEELYLRMNARGKLLTNFEKFKSELEKKADDNQWEKFCDEKNKFYFKADRQWTDLFWRNYKLESDEAFLNFIVEFIIVRKTLNIENFENNNGKEEVKKVQNLAENLGNLSADDFDENSFIELKKVLDVYQKDENDSKKPKLNLWDFCKNGNTLFSTICKIKGAMNVTYPVRGIFFAQTLYLQKSNFDESSFNDWMRVIRNIARNARIDTVQTFKGFLNLILELSNGCDNIHKYLAGNKVKSNFAKVQVQEEVYKSKIILKNKDSKNLFEDFEENPFCFGRLYFAFYCCGIDLQNSKAKETDFDLELFKKVKKVFEKYFSKDDVPDDFRVLLFTCGNNDFYTYWFSWSYMTNTNKRCCIETTDDLKASFSRPESKKYYKEILKEAVLKLTREKQIGKLISEYECPKKMPEWEKWIIKNPEEFSRHCSGRYFGITKDGKNCYLYEHWKRPNSRNDCFRIPVK